MLKMETINAERVESALSILRAAAAPLTVSQKRRREDEHRSLCSTAKATSEDQSSRYHTLRLLQWDESAYKARLATFSPRSWFGLAESLGPQLCAARGWANSAQGQLSCSNCRACWHVEGTLPFASLSEQLFLKHEQSCSWRLMRCPAEMGSMFSALSATADKGGGSRGAVGNSKLPGRHGRLVPRPISLEAAGVEQRLADHAIAAARATLCVVRMREIFSASTLTDLIESTLAALMARVARDNSCRSDPEVATPASPWLASLLQSWCRSLWADAGEDLLRAEPSGTAAAAPSAVSPPPVKRGTALAAAKAADRLPVSAAAAALRLAALAVLCGWCVASSRGRVVSEDADASSGSCVAEAGPVFECACCAGSLSLQRLLPPPDSAGLEVSGPSGAGAAASTHTGGAAPSPDGSASGSSAASALSALMDARRHTRIQAAIQSARAAGAAARATIVSARAADVTAAAATAAASRAAAASGSAASASPSSSTSAAIPGSGSASGSALGLGLSLPLRLPTDFVSTSLASTPATASTPAAQGSPRAAGSAGRLHSADAAAAAAAGTDGGRTPLEAAAASLSSRRSLGPGAAASSLPTTASQPLPLLLSAHQWFCPWRETATPASAALAAALRDASAPASAADSSATQTATPTTAAHAAAAASGAAGSTAGSASDTSGSAWQTAVLRGAAMLSDAALGCVAPPASMALAALAASSSSSSNSSSGSSSSGKSAAGVTAAGLPQAGSHIIDAGASDRLLPLPAASDVATKASGSVALGGVGSKAADAGARRPLQQQQLLPGWLVAFGILSVALRDA